MSTKKQAEAEATAGLEAIEGGNKVERIRDIVFGAQMREYNQRFDTIGRDISRLQQELAKTNEQMVNQLRQIGAQIQELDKRINEKIQSSSRQLTERIDEVDQQHANRLREVDNQAAQQLREQSERLSARVQEFHNATAHQFDELQQTLRHTGEEIRAELRHNADHLAHAKVERSTLGQLLIELGSSLQVESNGGMFDHLLDELADELDA